MFKFKKMIFMTLVLTLSLFTTRVFGNETERDSEIDIHEVRPSSGKPRVPEYNPLIITCFVDSDTYDLRIETNRDVTADILIESYCNPDNNIIWNGIINGASIISIGPNGSYHIYISIVGGKQYEGCFEI